MAVDDDYTKLLVHCDGNNDGIYLSDEAGHHRNLTSTGNICTKTAQKKFGISAGYCDGSGDYVNAGSVNIATGPFTFDIWFRLNSIGRIHYLWSYGGSNSGFCLYVSGSDNKLAISADNGTRKIGSINAVAAETWYHARVVGNGAVAGSRNMKLYLDGVYQGIWTTNYNFTKSVYVGANEAATNECLLGYWDEFRLSLVERCTTDFTVETSPYTADEDTALLIHANGLDGNVVFTDDSQYLLAGGNARTKTAINKFGESSLYLDGTGDYLGIVDSVDWAFGADDWTIDLWLYLNSNTMGGVVSQSEDDSNRWQFTYVDTNTTLSLYTQVGSSGNIRIAWTVGNIVGAWHHIELARSGATMLCFLDGVLLTATVTHGLDAGEYWPNIPASLTFGRSRNAGGYVYLPCYMDEIRISKGICRHTEDFTPPTEPYGPPTASGILFATFI